MPQWRDTARCGNVRCKGRCQDDACDPVAVTHSDAPLCSSNAVRLRPTREPASSHMLQPTRFNQRTSTNARTSFVPYSSQSAHMGVSFTCNVFQYGKMYNLLYSLRYHIKKCGKIYNTLSSLRYHIKLVHHGESSFYNMQEEPCDPVAVTRSDDPPCSSDAVTREPASSIALQDCGATIMAIEDVCHPQGDNNDVSRHYCNLCAKSYTEQAHLQRHVKSAHLGWYSCNLCGKRYFHQLYLRMHVKSAHRVVYLSKRTSNPCRERGKCMRGRKSHLEAITSFLPLPLATHLKAANTTPAAAPVNAEETMPLEDEDDENANTLLRSPKKSAHLGVSYSCDECEKSYVCKQALRRHIRSAHHLGV
jgi:hypothetical protein